MHLRRTLGRRAGRLTALAVTGAVLAAAVTGCASTGSADAPAADADLESVLQEPADLELWTWSTNVQAVVDAFEAKYPKIHIEVVNVGTGNDHYTKLENAIKAGKGAPDIATMEYANLPQFALSGSLVDLKDFGFDRYEDQYSPAVWQMVNVGDGLYELPHNQGPMALFYNQSVFDAHGVAVPTTWDEYLDAARKIHAADPEAYIAADTGDNGFTQSMIWAFGGTPFHTENGTDVTIDLADEGASAYAEFYQHLLDEGLLAPVSGWSDEWYKGLADGKIATLATGAWMAGSLASGVEQGAGQWRVAALPTVDGEPASAMNGGGGFGILEQSKHQQVAAAFLEFMETGEGRPIWIAAGQFPTMIEDLEDPEFLDAKNDYFGGQQINRVFAESAAHVNEGWQYLPYNGYAGTIFGDYVGKAYLGEETLADGLRDWGDALAEYGEAQGFTVDR
jgi:multiple sugar transport system substrate-binding protein